MPPFDKEFLELRVAKEWRLTPTQWRATGMDDRALMMAFEMFSDTRELFRQEWHEKNRGKKGKGRDANAYDKMRKDLGIEK